MDNGNSCLKCPNFWNNQPNEEKCQKCQDHKRLVDVLAEMPPLFMKDEVLKYGYHLRQD